MSRYLYPALIRRLYPVWQIPRDPAMRCQYCLMLQSYSGSGVLSSNIHERRLHVSAVRSNKHDDKNKKKSEDLKGIKKKVKWAYIKPNMTVTEVADKLSVPLGEILTSLLLITNRKYLPHHEIKDAHTLERVGLMMKRRFKIVRDLKTSTSISVEDDIENVASLAEPTQQPEKKVAEKMVVQDIEKQGPADPGDLAWRAPVVTIMGHVDHGKTTLLDALRESSVVDQEFGGITQHIGAFNVKLASGQSITFLDTPGHAAFTAMRARGASLTDIIVLVVAAEDGIMPQTIESIQHAQSENVPLIVAINKIDKHQADINKVKNMLTLYGVILEEYGGDVQVVPISALKRMNLDKLEECITTLAEFLELRGDPVGMVEGRIVETRTDSGRGKMATILVQRGTLKKGDLLIAGTTWTKVRAMYDSNGQTVMEAAPSCPVEVAGWKELPTTGDEVLQVDKEKRLKKALEFRLDQQNRDKETMDAEVIDDKRKEEKDIYDTKRAEKLAYLKRRGIRRRMSIRRSETMMNSGLQTEELEDKESMKPTFPIIIKGDVAGSVEAIIDTLATFHSELCEIVILHSGVGDVTPYDLELADVFKGEIYAFNVSVSAQAGVSQYNVEIKNHNVIYHLFDELVKTINTRLPKLVEEEIIGEATILQQYTVTEKRQGTKTDVLVAGCRCVSGSLERNQLFKVIQNDEVIYQGNLASLKHHKDEARSITVNQECGICFNKSSSVKFQPGDTVICYTNVEKVQTLDWEPGYLDTS